MTKNSFINKISFGSSFLQIIIYIFDCVTADDNLTYCPSKPNFSTKNLTIIDIGMQYFRYVNFASYSNRDMVFLATSYNGYEEGRMFYGIKENGRPFFNNYFFFSKGLCQHKYESESLVIKESGNTTNKEFLMSFSLENSCVELYDFVNKMLYGKTIDLFTSNTICSFRNVFISLKPNDTNYYNLLGFINYDQEYIIQKHLFYSINNFYENNTLINNITIKNIRAIKTHGSGLSCFQTEIQYIICFFLNQSTNYYIIAFDTNLKEINNTTLDSIINMIDDPFYKCIHLKDEIGIFTYYDNSFPVLLFREFNNISGFTNYIIPKVILEQKNNFSKDISLNDIIKFTENKIYYCTTDINRENIYIISIYLYKETYKIRYYIIEVTKYMSKIKIHKEMRMHIYNNFLAFGVSYEINNENNYYNALLIFNYPNNTDYNLPLIQNLFLNYNHSDIYINLEKDAKIENNIFGYVFSGIIISHLENCDNLKLNSSISGDKINPNYTLTKNESIKLGFNNNYTKFICNIQYRYIITEPELECFDKYPKNYSGHNETPDEFYTIKDKYIGRLNYYNIILNESLTTDCEDINCELCLEKSNSSCIICKYNFTFSADNKKNCLDQVKKENVLLPCLQYYD